jgi:hypoxanthine-guanine phosphoribosyltransferase
MKRLLYLLVAFLGQYSYGQNISGDTTFKVIYDSRTESERQPIYILNDRIIDGSILKALDLKNISEIKVIKRDTVIGSKIYYGKIYLVTKKTYEPNLLSLTSLKSDYTSNKDVPTIFMIDNEIIDKDYDDYFVDLNYILRIIIKPVEISKEGIRFNLIQILTKTKDNIKKVNEIRIRGDETLIED